MNWTFSKTVILSESISMFIQTESWPHKLYITLQAPCRLGPPTEEVIIKMPPGPVAKTWTKKQSLDKKKQNHGSMGMNVNNRKP